MLYTGSLVFVSDSLDVSGIRDRKTPHSVFVVNSVWDYMMHIHIGNSEVKITFNRASYLEKRETSFKAVACHKALKTSLVENTHTGN